MALALLSSLMGGGGGGGLFGASSSQAATSGGNFSTGNVHQVGGKGNTATVTTKQTSEQSADAKASAEAKAAAAASPYGDGEDVGTETVSSGSGFSLRSIPPIAWIIGGVALLLVLVLSMSSD